MDINIEVTEEMEMPCQCRCGEWFDLDDGIGDPKSNEVLCQKCGEKAEAIFELEEDIEICEEQIAGHIADLEYEQKRLVELKEKMQKLVA